MRLAVSFFSCGLVLASLGALADETETPDARAHQAFEDAKALYSEGKYSEASMKFKEANRLRPSWKLYYNIAQSEAAAKRHGLALEAFEEYVARAGDDIPEERRDLVISEMERLRPIVGFVNVTSKTYKGAAVIIDGVHRGELPLSGALMLGAGMDHQLRIEYEAGVLLERAVRVVGKQTIQVDLDAALAPRAPTETPVDSSPPKPKPTDESGSTPSPERNFAKRVLGLSGIGVGAALLVAGAVTGGLALSQYSDLKDKCIDNQCPSTNDKEMGDRADTLALVTDVLLPTGAVIGTVGIVLLVLSQGNKGEADSQKVGFAPVLGPNQRGVFVEGRF